MKANGNIGDYDESDPNGVGYQIITPGGIQVFDKDEKEEYLDAKKRTLEWLKMHSVPALS